MDQIDELRQLEFKQYEMEKRYKQEQELSSLQGDELKQRQNEEQLKKKKCTLITKKSIFH